MLRTMSGRGVGIGLLALLGIAGCGGAVPTAAPESTVAEMSLQQAATRSLGVTFQNPRTAFSSEKIDLYTGKTLPADDGMSPEGDISFFFDGSRFQVIANSGGGATRELAPAESGKATGEIAMAPIPLREGSEVLLRLDRGVYMIRITGLDAGSMAFLPTGSGTGTGSVTFAYQRHSEAPSKAI